MKIASPLILAGNPPVQTDCGLVCSVLHSFVTFELSQTKATPIQLAYDAGAQKWRGSGACNGALIEARLYRADLGIGADWYFDVDCDGAAQVTAAVFPLETLDPFAGGGSVPGTYTCCGLTDESGSLIFEVTE